MDELLIEKVQQGYKAVKMNATGPFECRPFYENDDRTGHWCPVYCSFPCQRQFFWVLTQLTGMDVKQGNQVQTLGTLTLGVSAIAIIFLITQIVN